ncbi:MAG TPA: type VI immunity family protein, partial [Acidobacteriota bacterium]|nr:type VI immunity family protein [Acidobacteriota bacterium]
GVDQPNDARTFMFHGFRPATEPGMASIFRFDFEWDFDPEELRSFTALVLQAVECICGIGGYVLSPDEGENAGQASDQMYAWAHRYWGAEAQDLEASPAGASNGLPCVNWLTVIGPNLRTRDPAACNQAKEVAHSWFEAGGHTVIQAEERPRLIDRNRREPLGNYVPVAEALLPLQVTHHPPFIGDSWDEDNTMRYLRRFTHPDEV